MKQTIYETITNQIVEAIEQGAGTFNMPWHRSAARFAPQNVVGKRAYRGLNVFSLWMIAEAKGYQSGEWATYQQWRELGAQVRKGEKAATVFFWKKLEKEDAAEASDGADESKGPRFVARAYSVFNADQVEGYQPPAYEPLPESERNAVAENFFRATAASIAFDGHTPCYDVKTDTIEMGPFESFKSAAGYYAVLAHEMIHWTGPRLDRNLSGRFGSESYAMEELIALSGQSAPPATLQ